MIGIICGCGFFTADIDVFGSHHRACSRKDFNVDAMFIQQQGGCLNLRHYLGVCEYHHPEAANLQNTLVKLAKYQSKIDKLVSTLNRMKETRGKKFDLNHLL